MFRVLDFASASWPRAGCAAMAAATSWLLVGCWITTVVDLLPPPQPTTKAAIARRVAGLAAVLRKEFMAHVSGTNDTILSPWLLRVHGRMKVAGGCRTGPKNAKTLRLAGPSVEPERG